MVRVVKKYQTLYPIYENNKKWQEIINSHDVFRIKN